MTVGEWRGGGGLQGWRGKCGVVAVVSSVASEGARSASWAQFSEVAPFHKSSFEVLEIGSLFILSFVFSDLGFPFFHGLGVRHNISNKRIIIHKGIR